MNNPTISFVRAKEEDWPTIFSLEISEIGNAIYAPETDINTLKEFFSHSTMYLIYMGDNVAGYYGYEKRENEAELTGLLVLKQFRNQGVGDAAVKKVINDVQPMNKIKVSTSPENTVALDLYQKNGFVITERIENYWQGQARLLLYRNQI